MKIPYVSPEIIEYLEYIYPDRRYTKVETLAELHESHGVTKVIEHLKSLSEDQAKRNMLTKD